VCGLFLLGYGIFRFVAEFAREPDAYLGFLALGLSMGQWLCVPMLLAGLGLFAWSRR
jgi:phosphatidylglycerol:prolipoprotein diacylglycerol transferase